MTMSMLVFVISSFCGIKTNLYSEEYKLACLETMVNCAIVEDGKTTNAQVNKCKEQWLSSEMSKK